MASSPVQWAMRTIRLGLALIVVPAALRGRRLPPPAVASALAVAAVVRVAHVAPAPRAVVEHHAVRVEQLGEDRVGGAVVACLARLCQWHHACGRPSASARVGRLSAAHGRRAGHSSRARHRLALADEPTDSLLVHRPRAADA